MQSIVFKILILCFVTETITCFRFVANQPSVDCSLLADGKSSKRFKCPEGDGNHIPAAPVTDQYPYNNAKNGKKGNERGGFQVPAPGDTAHEYRAPKSTDIRGPCPGLNAAANHGFIARDGIVTFNELVDAQQNVFNVGYDLAILMSFMGLINGGDLVTQKLSIGCDATNRTSFNPSITGCQRGLNGHDKFQSDSSLTRSDYFLADGDNFSFNHTLFMMMANFTEGLFNRDNLGKYRLERYQQSLHENEHFHFDPFYSVILFGSISFLTQLFPSGPHYIPDTATMSSFFGASDDENAERIPDNWTNRIEPYHIVDHLTELVLLYEQYPERFGDATESDGFHSIDSGIIMDGKFTASPSHDIVFCLLHQIIMQAMPSYLSKVRLIQPRYVITAKQFIERIFKTTGLKNLVCPLM